MCRHAETFAIVLPRQRICLMSCPDDRITKIWLSKNTDARKGFIEPTCYFHCPRVVAFISIDT